MLDLEFIPYSVSIRDFPNSLPINYYPWSYIIFNGLVRMVNRVVSTKFAIDITIFSSYIVILDHPVTGSIIVTAFIFKFYFLSLSSYDMG